MEQSITQQPFKKQSRFHKPEVWIGIVVLVIGLSVFQDYLFSRIRNTGFYISESLLYNSIWGFLVPLALLQKRLLKKFTPKNKLKQVFFLIVVSSVLTGTHLFIFASFFVLVSYFVFSPTHYFSAIFNAAISNQFYILILFYTFVPFLFKSLKRTRQNIQPLPEYPEIITVKVGLKTVTLKTEAIEIVSTEKPYTVIAIDHKKYLDNRTLKDFETLLNPTYFVRVHRSAIINKNFVKELTSRKNGDYDAQLQNGQTIRFSRHYRANWQNLLQ